MPVVVRIEPFSNHHVRLFLAGWQEYKGRAPLNLYELIQQDKNIQDICRNRLLLTILTGLYLELDKFELQKSRERFYDEAVNELLVKRPERRSQEQTFSKDQKTTVLSLLSLDKLEKTDVGNDPEKLRRSEISDYARQVLGDKCDVVAYENELVQVNSIIKLVGDENFVYAHRTIQEYFAAREAQREREVDEVLWTFGAKQELAEVLYFYCGMLRNITQINKAVAFFAGREAYLEAGEVLLNVTEAPDTDLIARVTEGLYRSATSLELSSHIELRALELLAGLSVSTGPAFESARGLFSKILDIIVSERSRGQLGKLKSVLSRSTEAAERLIPVLVHEGPEDWRRAAARASATLAPTVRLMS